jgi:hypothetical protein
MRSVSTASRLPIRQIKIYIASETLWALIVSNSDPLPSGAIQGNVHQLLNQHPDPS